MSIFKKDGGFFHTLIKWISGKNTADSAVDSANSWLDAQTGRALTGAQQQQNSFNAEQAQLSRDWSEQMDNTKYQRTVADMKAAGVNPAMAMSGGVTAPPSSSTASSGSSNPVASMSDIMSLILGKKQGRLLDAQAQQARDQGAAAKTQAKAALINADTGVRGQDLREEEFYTVTQPLALNTVRIGDSTIEVNDEMVKKLRAEVDQLAADTTLIELHQLADALNIQYKLETWEDSKKMLAQQIAKTTAEEAVSWALSEQATQNAKEKALDNKWTEVYVEYWTRPENVQRGVNIERLKGTSAATAGMAYSQAIGDKIDEGPREKYKQAGKDLRRFATGPIPSLKPSRKGGQR